MTKELENHGSDLSIVQGILQYELNIGLFLSYLDTNISQNLSFIMDRFSRQTTHINSLHIYTCGGTGGWRRVVYLDMTEPNTNCPAGC